MRRHRRPALRPSVRIHQGHTGCPERLESPLPLWRRAYGVVFDAGSLQGVSEVPVAPVVVTLLRPRPALRPGKHRPTLTRPAGQTPQSAPGVPPDLRQRSPSTLSLVAVRRGASLSPAASTSP